MAPAVSRSGVSLSSDRRGGCTPCSRPGSGSICVDDEYLRCVAVSPTVVVCSFVLEIPVLCVFFCNCVLRSGYVDVLCKACVI